MHDMRNGREADLGRSPCLWSTVCDLIDFVPGDRHDFAREPLYQCVWEIDWCVPSPVHLRILSANFPVHIEVLHLAFDIV